MDLEGTTKLVFASLAMRSSQPLPIGVLPDKMLIAPRLNANNDQVDKSEKVIEKHFAELIRRLDGSWRWDKTDNWYIVFQQDDFTRQTLQTNTVCKMHKNLKRFAGMP
jgi:hypothetical protein